MRTSTCQIRSGILFVMLRHEEQKELNLLRKFLAQKSPSYAGRLFELLCAQYEQDGGGLTYRQIVEASGFGTVTWPDVESNARSVLDLLDDKFRLYYEDLGRRSDYVFRVRCVDCSDSAKQSGFQLVTTYRGPTGRPLQVFLCHSSDDKPAVRDLHERLRINGFEPWLDEVDLVPGQDWEYEISNAVRKSDAIIACLSSSSVPKEGFVQKEIKMALDFAEEKPEGTIFIIPLKLDDCTVPARMKKWHWVNYFEEGGSNRLVQALKIRAEDLEKKRS